MSSELFHRFDLPGDVMCHPGEAGSAGRGQPGRNPALLPCAIAGSTALLLWVPCSKSSFLCCSVKHHPYLCLPGPSMAPSKPCPSRAFKHVEGHESTLSRGLLWPFANPHACGQHSMTQQKQLLTTPISVFAQQHSSSEPFLPYAFSLSTAIVESYIHTLRRVSFYPTFQINRHN